jgi:hypothetical protein
LEGKILPAVPAQLKGDSFDPVRMRVERVVLLDINLPFDFLVSLNWDFCVGWHQLLLGICKLLSVIQRKNMSIEIIPFDIEFFLEKIKKVIIVWQMVRYISS